MGRANLVNRLMDENKSRFRPDFPAFSGERWMPGQNALPKA